MGTVIVYRVEDAGGCGPYNTCRLGFKNYDKILTLMPPFSQHPTPDKDGLDIDINQYCGFESVESAENWFGREGLGFLSGCGFGLWAFTVPKQKISYGAHQLIFERAAAVQRVRVL